MIPGLKKALLVALLIMGMFLAATGLLDRSLNWCGLARLSQANTRYLDGAFEKALAGFLILSSIKSGLAVVEGSGVGIGFNLEVGDVVQPAYDYVDVAWRAAMAGGSIIALMQLALSGIALIDHWALAVLLLLVLFWQLSQWCLPGSGGVQGYLRASVHFGMTLCLALYLLLPLSITAAAVVSKQITAPMLENSQAELQRLSNTLSPEGLHQRFLTDLSTESGGTLDIKARVTKLGRGLKELMTFLKVETKNVAGLTLKLIAAYVFDCILFPLFFGLILMTMLKSGVRCLFEFHRPQALPSAPSQ